MKTMPTPKQQIVDLLDSLSNLDQQRILAFTRTLLRISGAHPAAEEKAETSTHPKGMSGKELVEFFQQFPITQEEADEMTHILEELRETRQVNER